MRVKPIERERWEAIQQGERAYHDQKDPASILEINLRYWKRILEAVSTEVALHEGVSALDIGCGGCGILLALPQGRHVGVDPLMEFYLAKFPFLRERKDIAWRSGTAEELEGEDRFDVVFLINTLDHTFDPDSALRTASQRVAPNGHLVVVLNCHNTRFFRWYFSTFQRFIDPHHPFQFSPDALVNKARGLELLMSKDVDHLWFPDDEDYRSRVLKKRGTNPGRFLKKALNPFMAPLALSRYLFARPTRRKRPGDNSIISIYLFVFRKTQ